jgi:hypothetical protein
VDSRLVSRQPQSIHSGFFTPVTSLRGTKSSLAIDEFGFALPAVVLVLAVIFWRLAKRVQPTELS